MRTNDSGARVLGVDACKRGWVGFSSDARGYFGATIAELVDAAQADGALAVVGIDIPIGLPDAGARRSDAMARGLIGRRASSVFTTPVRPALDATSHREATAINVELSGKGLSQQAYHLGPKIQQVDSWVRGDLSFAVIEVHPELSFATMAGRPLDHPKTTWAGSAERRDILEAQGIVVPGDLGPAGHVAAPDDVLDAAAASWTAARFAAGSAVSLPSPPESFGDGLAAAIWR